MGLPAPKVAEASETAVLDVGQTALLLAGTVTCGKTVVTTPADVILRMNLKASLLPVVET